MRLTLALLGHTLDISLEPTATEAAEDEAPTNQGDTGAALSGGSLVSSGPVGFTPSLPTPAEWQPPERTLPWDEPLE